MIPPSIFLSCNTSNQFAILLVVVSTVCALLRVFTRGQNDGHSHSIVLCTERCPTVDGQKLHCLYHLQLWKMKYLSNRLRPGFADAKAVSRNALSAKHILHET